MSDWKFDLDEVGPEAEAAEDGGDSAPPVEPGSPSIEHVIPFLAGVGLALFIFVQVL